MDSTLLWNNGDMMCPVSKGDPVLNSDPRVLQQLIRVERLNGKTFRFVNHRCYFKEVQDEVQPYMRRILTKWMMEVCEEQGMEDIVFPLATSYVDRFLSCVRIQKTQLQLLGAVCLLIASKLRQCRSLTVDALIYYTDYSVTTKDITTWEMLVLRSLKWDMASVIASDFVDPLLSRLDIDREDLVRRHAHTFIALCATEEKFLVYSASLLAVSCVAVAINGLTWLQKPWKSSIELVMKLTELTDINTKYVQTCMKDIEDLLALNIAQLQQTVSKTTSSTSNKVNCSIAANGQPETPTDVQDVLF
ncbi:LOW QUALITY PROTEIN: G1/S-specific cyclin-D3-like [Uloborus diversus]|uniref:LOW QUALITY PROTEIN: G1/S-specific cyclin-D3-like n=1 Tax=Uloborus diversus TaxID=327109 RepID=UPI0024095C43|nr:LOW QUALITY PROTEIN: G1/S-specific cyclin-D3-like [Uloborus diversus]